jgi:hypothetical protein
VDLLGRTLKILSNEIQSPGNHSLTVNGRDFTSGVYFYKIQTDNFVETKKMVILK